MKDFSKGWCFYIQTCLRHPAVSHVARGDALSLPLSCRSSLSHFQSPRGCIKGPGFSPNQHSILHAKPPPCAALENFYTKEPEWIESGLVCRSWLDAKTGRFPFSGAEKPLLFVEKTVTSFLALHSTLCWGVSQTVLPKKNYNRTTITYVRHINFSTLRCF